MAYGAEDALPNGTLVQGRYRTIGIVGRGGVGTVYQAHDTLFGKNNAYALKELIDQSPGARKQFENEAQWLKALDHPNIPKVRESFEWEHRLYLVMDFVDGENLEQKLVRRGGKPLAEQQVLQWITPVCEALHYLHMQQPPILHRDVKPANIIVTPADLPVLVDLGIAKVHMPGGGQTATFVRKAGTEGYAPPEQYTAAGKTGPWSDVYGLGATLYELLTGMIPPTAVERIALDSALVRPRALNPQISPRIEEVILRAMAIRPADRYQTMVECMRALSPYPTGPSRVSTPGMVGYGGDPAQAATASWRSVPSESVMGGPAPSGDRSSYPRPPAPPPPGMMGQLPSLGATSPPLFAPPQPPQFSANPSYPASGLSRPRGDAYNPSGLGPSSQGRPSSNTLYAAGAELSVQQSAGGVSDMFGDAPASVSAENRTRRTRNFPWLAAVILVLICVVGVAVALGTNLLGSLTPPDRSSPQAAVTGYFQAISAQDYAKAWQFTSSSRNDPNSNAAFASARKSEDDQSGKVLSATITTVDADSTGRVHVQAKVMRAGASTPFDYSFVLANYGGATWLIESVTAG